MGTDFRLLNDLEENNSEELEERKENVALAGPQQQKTAFAPTSIDAILHGMNSPDPEKQAAAMREARRLAATAPDQLLLLARKEAAFYRRRTIQGTLVSVAVVGSLAAIALISGNGGEFFLYLLGASALAAAMWLGAYLPRRSRRNMIEILDGIDDPRLLGSVLTMLIPDGVTEVKTAITLNGQMRMFVTRILMEMLPKVRAEHKVFLTREQMQLLLTLMKQYQSTPQLTIAILRALQPIGDESAIPAIQFLMLSRNAIVKAEARECLEYLELRADQKRLAMTLLRASDSAGTGSSELLLRAAAGAADIAPEQLLRSGPQV